MTNPLDAATRAIAINWGYDPDLHWRGNISDDNVGEAAEAALRAALPAEPSAEAIDEMVEAMAADDGSFASMSIAAYRALRAHILGGEA